MKLEDQSGAIKQYLLNRMTEEERIHFENLIREDTALFEEVKLQIEIYELAGDKDFQTIFPLLKAQDEIYHQNQRRSQKIKIILFIILLVLVILLAVYFF